jgi:hypothetical protein
VEAVAAAEDSVVVVAAEEAEGDYRIGSHCVLWIMDAGLMYGAGREIGSINIYAKLSHDEFVNLDLRRRYALIK